MAYTIIRINKCKMGAVSKLEKHHEREKEKYKSNPDIDQTRSDQNFHLISPPTRYRKFILNRISEVGAKRRKDSVVMQDGFVTASPEWMQTKSPEEQREYFRYALEFIKERYGEENIISAVVHMDEKNPHMHFTFVPITKDNRLSSKEIIGGPKGLVKLQDEFYEHMNKKYPELLRGIPVKVSHRKHIPTYLFKNANRLYEHYNEICTAINDIGLIGNSKKKDEAIALLGKYAPEMAALKEQLKSTDERIRQLEYDNRIVREVNYDSKVKNEEQSFEIEKLNQSLYELNEKQKKLQKVINLVPQNLLEDLIEQEKRRRRQKHREERER